MRTKPSRAMIFISEGENYFACRTAEFQGLKVGEQYECSVVCSNGQLAIFYAVNLINVKINQVCKTH